MPRRNEREFEERRQQIINGALHVFADKGFEEATNRDIAEAANIGSPGLIYHYFADKQDLFRQVLEQKMPLLQLLAQSDELMTLPPRQTLTRIGHAYLRILDNPRAAVCMKLLISEVARRPALAKMAHEIGPGRAFAFLSAYFQQQMEQGVLRRSDPTLAVYHFISPLVVFLMRRIVFEQPDAIAQDAAAFVENTVEFFLRAMQPDAPKGECAHAAS